MDCMVTVTSLCSPWTSPQKDHRQPISLKRRGLKPATQVIPPPSSPALPLLSYRLRHAIHFLFNLGGLNRLHVLVSAAIGMSPL